jgi:hypothetical protein
MKPNLTRRSAVVPSSFGVAASSGPVRPCQGRELTSSEKANVRVVIDFYASWPSHSLDRVISFFVENVRLARQAETRSR